MALEAIFVIAVAVVGLVLLPFFLVWWGIDKPRTWRKPKDVGLGYYEHP